MHGSKSSDSTIREELLRFNLISEASLELFSQGTRDNPEISVFRDKNTGIIFHDFYVGDEFFKSTNGGFDGLNRNSDVAVGSPQSGLRLELFNDSKRRYISNLPFIANRLVLDFGCGGGGFLRCAREVAKGVVGVDLNDSCREKLKRDGIGSWSSVPEEIDVDTVTMFHTLEHVPSQINTLMGVYDALKNSATRRDSQGVAIVEVPHANDFLLTSLASQEFRKFTLRSDHCILHTRTSLIKFMEFVGFEKVSVRSVRRYPLSNHLGWLSRNKPGGHMSDLSSIDSNNLHSEYENSLARNNATDTLVAFGFVDMN